ncbi:hypothetical protein WA026_011994 [Henosepilachna vigintioctopunctata]|uniref:Uncharacterized protein n=1 Tax=Henosepilachna vigintioctopunctata TaxID=420089 RepID=A0AAW1VBY8_9CUCU
MFIEIIVVVLIIYSFIRFFISRKSDSLSCLVGKTAIVTGGNSGIGYATSLLLASRGCKVIIADCMNAEKSRDEIIKETGNPLVVYKHLDLASFEAIRQFVKDIGNTEEKIDILINNAGASTASSKVTEDGLNSIMQINYFGAFLLTHLLLDKLKASGSARVIFLGSVSIFTHTVNLNNLNLTDYDPKRALWRLYANSKFCNVFAAQEFGKKLKKFGICVNSVDPGAVKTPIFEKTLKVNSRWNISVPIALALIIFGQDPLSGSQTIFDVATNSKYETKTGGHYSFLCPWFKPKVLRNKKFCDDIWKESENLTKLKEEEKI